MLAERCRCSATGSNTVEALYKDQGCFDSFFDGERPTHKVCILRKKNLINLMLRGWVFVIQGFHCISKLKSLEGNEAAQQWHHRRKSFNAGQDEKD